MHSWLKYQIPSEPLPSIPCHVFYQRHTIGYHIKSEVATKFRQWATQRLKDYLIQGYAVNQKRLAQKQQQVQTLKDGIRILSRAIETETGDVHSPWLNQFAKGLELLDDYDHERLDQNGRTTRPATYPELSDYQNVVELMRGDFQSAVFGKEKDFSHECTNKSVIIRAFVATILPPFSAFNEPLSLPTIACRVFYQRYTVGILPRIIYIC